MGRAWALGCRSEFGGVFECEVGEDEDESGGVSVRRSAVPPLFPYRVEITHTLSPIYEEFNSYSRRAQENVPSFP